MQHTCSQIDIFFSILFISDDSQISTSLLNAITVYEKNRNWFKPKCP